MTEEQLEKLNAKTRKAHEIALWIVIFLWVIAVSYGVGIWIHWIAGAIMGLGNCLYLLVKIGNHLK